MTRLNCCLRAIRTGTCLLFLALTLSLLTSCAGDGGGKLAIRSAAEPQKVLTGGFDRVIYNYDDKNTLTILLLSGPMDQLEQAVTIRMFWKPQAGRTPIDARATNATVHYIIFGSTDQGDQVGVYSGAGYVFPNTSLGAGNLGLGVWDANLRLTDSSQSFRDLLGQAVLRGRVTASRDDAATLATLRQLNMLVRERLGYPRLVDAFDSQDAPSAAPAPVAPGLLTDNKLPWPG